MNRNSTVERMLNNERNSPVQGTSNNPTTFAIRNLSVLAYANGFTLWHYKAGKEQLENVGKPNFFADASNMLAAGDMILVSAADGGRVLVVASSDMEAVNTAPLS